MRRIFVVTSLCCVVAACSDLTPTSSPALPSSTTVAVPMDLEPAPSDSPELFDDGSEGLPVSGTTLNLDDAARKSALTKGETVMSLFVRRDLPAKQWFSELSPHLTTSLAQAHQYTDPVNVPATAVTGSPNLTPASGPQLARVNVPTDVGGYLVILTRTDSQPEWRVDRIIQPEHLEVFDG